MNISKYIYDYLMEYSTPVIVPELGCFSIVSKPSEIRDGVVIPPVKTVEFDCENTEDDRVLTGYIAQKENLTIEQVAEEVKKFYNHYFINKLSPVNDVSFENFGAFSLNKACNIVFKPDDHFFKDYYGLGYAYIPGNVQSQSVAEPVVPEPAFPPEPVRPEPVTPLIEEKKDTQPQSGNSLFDMSDSTRFRENKERRRTEQKEQKQKQPVRPTHTAKAAPKYKKRQKQLKNSHSNLWVLWVLIIAVGLAVAGYIVNSTFFSKKTATSTVVDTGREVNPASADDNEENIPNSELAQTLDDANDKKNVLNPESSQQPVASTAQTKPEPEPSKPESEPSKPKSTTATQPQGNGRYVLVIGSFTTHLAAEKHCKKLQAEGIPYEIIDAGNQRFRVSVASFDDKDEAIRQAAQMKSKPYCEDVWVIRR